MGENITMHPHPPARLRAAPDRSSIEELDRAEVSEALEAIEIAEWVDWIQSEIPGVRFVLPDDETAVLIAARAVRFASRIQGVFGELPGATAEEFIRALIFHQCWARLGPEQNSAIPLLPLAKVKLPVVSAVKHVRRLRGEGQLHLMMANDGAEYAVRFPNGPRGNRSLATDAICTELARSIGLLVPPTAIVLVDDRVVEQSPDLRLRLGRENIKPKSGPCLGSRMVKAECETIPGSDCIPPEVGREPRILHQFRGAFILDFLTLNRGNRKALFVPNPRSGKLEPVFVGHGECLMGNDWSAFLAAEDGLPQSHPFSSRAVSRRRSLSGWVSRIENLSLKDLWEVAFQLPGDWYDWDRMLLIHVLEKLGARRLALRAALFRGESTCACS